MTVVFSTSNGDIIQCPVLEVIGGLPATKTPGWSVTNIGCCTVLDEGDTTITLTGSLFGKGAQTVITVAGIGSYLVATHMFELNNDSWIAALPQINEAIETTLDTYLRPYEWVKNNENI